MARGGGNSGEPVRSLPGGTGPLSAMVTPPGWLPPSTSTLDLASRRKKATWRCGGLKLRVKTKKSPSRACSTTATFSPQVRQDLALSFRVEGVPAFSRQWPTSTGRGHQCRFRPAASYKFHLRLNWLRLLLWMIARLILAESSGKHRLQPT